MAATAKHSDDEADEQVVRFPPDEEAALVVEANDNKTEANSLFVRGHYDDALTAYERAAAVLPVYRYYDLAVLRANMAACHLKRSAWKEAIQCGTGALDALDALDRADKATPPKDATEAEDAPGDASKVDEDVDEEIISAGAAEAASLPSTEAQQPTVDDRRRIRAKALLRRARARAELGGWANLAGAEEDYRTLVALPADTLGAADRRLAAQQLRTLPERTSAAKEEEMGEMMGKLKELGNGLLRPFGISTDNFQMVKDENTGGYSMNFRPSGS